MKQILLASTLALTVGCATAIMRPYVGEQQAWPTVEGSIVNTKYEIPIFNSLPPVPYDVVGELRVESPLYAQPEEHHMSTLIAKARQFKAHALVLVDGQLFFGPNYGPRSSVLDASPTMSRGLTQVNRFLPESFRPGVSVIAVRWLEGAPQGLPAKYDKLAPPYQPSAKPLPSKPIVETKPVKPVSPKPAVPAVAPKSNISPATPAASSEAPAPRKKTAKPDEAR
ncbi:MAG: hypothetical protein FJ395_09565 [Verrucomicrobia bacterium]|nr:hypothetical protein [Verrucomicrobiota bacterium]